MKSGSKFPIGRKIADSESTLSLKVRRDSTLRPARLFANAKLVEHSMEIVGVDAE